MLEVKLNLTTIDKVKGFVNILTKFNGQFDLVSGRYIVDAKSIMGIFSLDLSAPITLQVEGCDDIEALKAELASYIA